MCTGVISDGIFGQLKLSSDVDIDYHKYLKRAVEALLRDRMKAF